MFTSFIKQTDGREKIDVIRKNILVQASKNGNLTKGAQQLPKQLQNFMKLMQLKEEVIKAKKHNSHTKQKEKKLLDGVYNNSKLKDYKQDNF